MVLRGIDELFICEHWQSAYLTWNWPRSKGDSWN